MDTILKDIFNESEYFESNSENVFIPKYLGLIINGVVVYDVNWVIVSNEELMLMNQKVKDHPISSVYLKNLNSILLITDEGIKEIL